jgi:hypothetical protein
MKAHKLRNVNLALPVSYSTNSRVIPDYTSARLYLYLLYEHEKVFYQIPTV